MNLARVTLSCVMLLLILPAASLAQESSGRAPLACAVEWSNGPPAASAVCDAIAQSLGRSVQRVDDARAVKRGDSVQLLDGEVFFIAVWLRDGRVRAFTRVSKMVAQGREVAVLARAVREISRTPAKSKVCLRVEANGGRQMLSDDLAYPWAELRGCKTTFAEVPDPWSDVKK